MRHTAGYLTLVCLVAFSSIADAQSLAAQETAAQRDQRMAWFREARFGMFIHWGLYAVPAGRYHGQDVDGIGEWIMNKAKIPIPEYEQFATQFNPTQFDARAWVKLAKDAGMRYIVITSKHHDGFCLWDSKVTDYDVIDRTPFHRDILKELSDACHEEGIRLCFYYSIMDWHNPDAQANGYNDAAHNPNFPRYVQSYLKPQVKELLTRYGPIGIMWFDGEWIGDWTGAMGHDLYRYCRELQPDVIVNNRVGKGRAGMTGTSAGPDAEGDYGTPEQEIPATGFPGLDWESCMTMNDTWGYKSQDDNWKSARQIVRMLIDCASKGGNLLLNVGPTPQGTLPQPSIDRLREIGQWMKVNGQSIHGTGPSPFAHLAYGKATSKPGKIYLHVFDWPADGTLRVPLRNTVKRAYLLADPGTALDVGSSNQGAAVKLPAHAPDSIASVIVIEIDGQPQVVDH